ncbi:hypothetical protein ASG37_14130 [Sphingomonas sp. Leaf407]|uniref:hypothetical protein n=1 Tax=unclassified Sphingomonas TaxID=196159 RepID=UPI0006FEBFE6|nr:MULTISPECIES: hypothetical protein [unclassified Sphingomonas]KQN35489.1 hypothetical protein ASE97_13385 [Sphingomonas sp. Leaf42]KQT26356.1 hypothetical protein ASG37_14130 [Sphingomonas sp. Leaf407]
MRIESAHIDAEHAFARGGHGELDAIRAIAHARDNLPALSVLAVVDAALARGERRSIAEWTALAREAVRCGLSDPATAQSFAAACAVRMAD